MPGDGTKNLIPPRSTEEARKRGEKGGIASGKARREKRALRETMQTLLAATLKNPEILAELKKEGWAQKGMTMQDAIAAAMIQQAMKGNVKAYREIRETVNEKTDAPQDVNGGKKIEFVFKDTSMKDESNTD